MNFTNVRYPTWILDYCAVEKNEKFDGFIYPLLYENEKSGEKERDKKINDITSKSGFFSFNLYLILSALDWSFLSMIDSFCINYYY